MDLKFMEKKQSRSKRKERAVTRQQPAHQENDNSSLSSLGSLPEAKSVVLQFNNEFTSQRRLTTHLPGSSAEHSKSAREMFAQKAHSRRAASSSKACPHCKKVFANAFAVPKHISQVHNRAGELHCSKCTYKNRSKQTLDQHERSAHRTCPHCRKVFLLLDRHMQHCSKRS